MGDIHDFWSGLTYVLGSLWKLMILLALILFFTALVNVVLKRINQSWSQKFVKKLDKIITSARGLKNVAKSFENLINIIYEAFASTVNLLVVIIEIFFITIDRFLLAPIIMFFAFLKIGLSKVENFTNKLHKTSEAPSEEAGGEKVARNDDLINSMLKVKGGDSLEIEKKDDLLEKMLKSKEDDVKGGDV